MAIRKLNGMLKAGIMEGFQYIPAEEGCLFTSDSEPVYYVVIWWFNEQIRLRMKRYCGLVVYADDFVACFQYKWEAERFYGHLKKRMEHFGLSLEEEKSRLIEFGRYIQESAEKRGKKVATFDFLGFTYYCSRSRNGRFRVKRKTSRKKSAKKCKEMYRLIQGMGNWPLREIIRKLNQILTNYFHYYGITDNSRSIGNFRFQVIKMLYNWLNKRSQKKSYSWKGYNDMLKVYPIVPARIYVSVYI